MQIQIKLPNVKLEEQRDDQDEERLQIGPDFHGFLPRGKLQDVAFVAPIKTKYLTFQLFVDFLVRKEAVFVLEEQIGSRRLSNC
jgi:hypothetical protein